MNILQLNFILCICYIFITRGIIAPLHVKDKIFLVVTYLQLILIHAFVEYSSVPDLSGYEEMFKNFGSLSWGECLNFSTGIEPGYAVINKLIYSLGFHFRGVLIGYSFCFLLALYKIIVKYSPIVKFSVIIILLTIFNQSLFVVRQYWALSIVIFSYKYIIERKILPFLIVVLTASLFHITALVTLPVYFLYGLNRKKLLIILIVLCFLTKIGLNAILVYGGMLIEAKSAYLQDDSFMSYVPLVESLFVLSCYCIALKNHVFKDGINKLLFVLCAVSACICIGGIGEVAIFIRLNLYFSLIPFLIFPMVIKRAKGVSNRFIISIFVIIFYYVLTFKSSSFDYLAGLKMDFLN